MEGDTVGFNVKIGSTYPSTERALVKLYVDGELKDSKEVDVGTSGTSVTLHWVAQAGGHDYTVKLYRLVNDHELWEDSWSDSLKVARDPDGLYAWLEVVPDRVDSGDGVVAFITIENTADYAQTWPVELVDNTGNVWWPESDKYVLDTNYTLSKGIITIQPHKTAHIMVTGIEVYQNTTFYLKVGGITMAMAYVEVNGSNVVHLKSIKCNDELYFKYDMGDYKATLTCYVTGYNAYHTTLELNGNILATINASYLNRYLSLPNGKTSPVVSDIKPKNIPRGEQFVLSSNVSFVVPAPDFKILPNSISDAFNDVRVEWSLSGKNVPVTIIYDIPFKDVNIQRIIIHYKVHLSVDHKAVVLDFISDVGITVFSWTKLSKIGEASIADVGFIQQSLNKLPPGIRDKIIPVFSWVSLNYVKERVITGLLG